MKPIRSRSTGLPSTPGTRTLMDLGLVEDTIDKREGKRVIYNGLTEKGMAVAKLLIKINEILSDGESAR